MSIRNHSKDKAGVSNSVFAISLIVLIVVAASGFGLYATSLGHASTTSSEMMSHSSNSASNSTGAYEFTPKSGAMISDAWLLVSSLGMNNEYAVAIHAEGLEPNGTYFVEGPLSSGSMQVVPISNESMTMSQESDSEFQANANGTGQFWIVLKINPATTFEGIELAFLPGMSMQNAMVVAVASFSSVMTSSMTSESMT
jgi:cytoskeletal protein RodZ